MYLSTDEHSEHRHAATTTKPYDDTNLEVIDHTSNNSISESNVMLEEELRNVFEFDSNSS
jgi:hypothetical protein